MEWIQCQYPKTAIHSPNGGLMLGQRLRRWHNINPPFTIGYCSRSPLAACGVSHSTSCLSHPIAVCKLVALLWNHCPAGIHTDREQMPGCLAPARKLKRPVRTDAFGKHVTTYEAAETEATTSSQTLSTSSLVLHVTQ